MSSQLNPPPIHACGGTILAAVLDGLPYRYCDTCGAFTYLYTDPDDDMPDGTDHDANIEAWDNGDDESPSADSGGMSEAALQRAERQQMGITD